MNTEHTKGPWRINGQTVTAKGDMKLTVCTCPSKVDPRPTVDAAASTHEQAIANARLIAAAPELLSIVHQQAMLAADIACCCQDVLRGLRDEAALLHLQEKAASLNETARAAIAKATGQ